MGGGLREPHGARVSHGLIFVIRPFRPDKNTWRAEVHGAWCLGGKVAGWLFLAGLIDGICWLDGWRVSWLMGWLCWLMADFGMAALIVSLQRSRCA